jgi:micrococcal nuclease
VRTPKVTYGPYRARFLRDTDGDTFWLDIDLGLRVHCSVPIRLAGLDAPEAKSVEGKAATAWVVDWFAQHPEVIVTTEKDPERWGRWLGVAGHAQPWDGTGPHPYE